METSTYRFLRTLQAHTANLKCGQRLAASRVSPATAANQATPQELRTLPGKSNTLATHSRTKTKNVHILLRHMDHLQVPLVGGSCTACVQVTGPLGHAHRHVGAGTALLKDPGGCTKEKAFQLGVSNWVRQKAVRP